MTDPEVTRTYLESEIEGLEPFDLILIAPSTTPLHVVEVTQNEAGGLEVRIPGRPPIVPPIDSTLHQALRDLEFDSPDPANPMQPWTRVVDNAATAVAILQQVQSEIFGEKPPLSLNIMHGSHRMEHEAKRKLSRVQSRVETILTELLGHGPEKDRDGDYILPLGQVHVTVAPRMIEGGEIVVRIFAITNMAVQVTPELGLFLARLNFGMMFGRFALDAEHRSIWFDETLLGEDFRENEFRFVVNTIATTADTWDDRIKQMFGGVTYQEVLAGRAKEELPPIKPGEGAGMYL